MLSETANVEFELACCRNLASDRVTRHWDAITALAVPPVARRKLTGDEVRAILRDYGTLNGGSSLAPDDRLAPEQDEGNVGGRRAHADNNLY